MDYRESTTDLNTLVVQEVLSKIMRNLAAEFALGLQEWLETSF